MRNPVDHSEDKWLQGQRFQGRSAIWVILGVWHHREGFELYEISTTSGEKAREITSKKLNELITEGKLKPITEAK